MPAWIRCEYCEEWWCTIHMKHTYDCDCPAIEDWSIDPYSEETLMDFQAAMTQVKAGRTVRREAWPTEQACVMDGGNEHLMLKIAVSVGSILIPYVVAKSDFVAGDWATVAP